MPWHDELGFSANPLDIRPNTNLVGLDQQERQLKNHIEKGELCFINGLTGTGKTSLLKKVQEDMDNYSFIYLDAHDLPADFNIEEELKSERSIFDRLTLREYPSDPPVLIIDEFQDTDENVIMQARSKWESKEQLHSIVIAQIEQHLENVSPSFEERIGKRTITLPSLTDGEMREILQQRLGEYYKKLHSEALNLLTEVADGNPRRLLEYTDAIFDFHHNKFGEYDPIKQSPTYTVTYYAAKEILEEHGVNVDAYDYLEPEAKAREDGEFEETFTEDEQALLRLMLEAPHTADQLAEEMDKSKSTIYRKLRNLRDKDAIEEAGKDGRKKQWQATEHVKRLTVDK